MSERPEAGPRGPADHDHGQRELGDSITELKQAEAALRQSQEVLSLLMRGGSMGAFSCDLATNQVWWSRELEEIFGLEPGGFAGTEKAFLDLVHEEDRPPVAQAIENAIRERADYQIEFRFRHASGTWRWMEGRGRSIYDERGRPTTLHGIGIDITERRRAEERFHLAVEAAPNAMVMADSQGRILLINTQAERLFGYRRDELLGLSVDLLVPERFRSKHPHYRRAFGSDPRTRPMGGGRDLFAVRKDGSEVPVEIGLNPIEIDGEVLVLSSIVDITERKRVELAHATSAAIVASSDDAIIGKTVAGVITSWNAAAERMFGYRAGEVAGRPITIIIPPERHDEERQLLERIARGERIEHFETVRVRADGERLDVSLTISPVVDAGGRVIGVSSIGRDITGRKRAETEREELLRREQAARERAEEASRIKDEFLATVSHELRTPLSAILGWACLLREAELDEGKARHAAEVIDRNARTQVQLIDDLLDVSRIITGKLRLSVRAVHLPEVVEAAIESLRLMAEAKGVTIQPILDSHAGAVLGDAGRLQQVVWNLVSNAIKFTPRGGRVQVCLERVYSHVEITVGDTGQGIHPDFLPHVFDRFRQADASSARVSGGLGLGLAIVRHLAELHGGSVSASSPGEGRGATFTVRLPTLVVHVPVPDLERVHPTAEVRRPPVPQREPDLSGVRVLVVDDEPDTRMLLREILLRCGADVQDAGSARHGLEQAEEWRPDVIVSDIGMPGEDGYELIRKLREREAAAGRRTPAVALTAYVRSEDRMRALLAGYQVHMSKPIDPMEFALVVAGLAPPGAKRREETEPAGR